MPIRSLRLNGLLSFAPESAPFELRDLNVLIGPNGSGKSNLIEAIDLLAAAPRDLAAVICDDHWQKDKGKEPRRDEARFPWFWEAGRFTGLSVNDLHLDLAAKQQACAHRQAN